MQTDYRPFDVQVTEEFLSVVRSNSLVTLPDVETLASLATELALSNLLLQALGDDERWLIRVGFLPALQDVQAQIKSDIVRESKRTHGVSRAQLHGDVDIRNAGILAVNHRHGLRQERDQQSVDNEAGSILAADGDLSDFLAEGEHAVEHRVARVGGADDFHQLHNLHRIEEMKSDKLLRATRSNSHVRDGQGRGIRSEDSVVVDNLAKVLVEIDLNLLDFNDSLNDQIAILQLVDVGGGSNQTHRLIKLGLAFRLGGNLARLQILGNNLGQRPRDSISSSTYKYTVILDERNTCPTCPCQPSKPQAWTPRQ